MFAVIEHMELKDAVKTLLKISDKTNNIIVSTNNIYFPAWGFFDDVTHVKPYSARTLYALLKITGFSRVNVYRIFEKGKLPLVVKKSISRILNQDFCQEIIAIAEK